MIIVLVKYVCKPGKREAFLKAIQERGLDAKSRAEVGNGKYEYSFSTTDPDVLFLTEFWQDKEVLATHGQMPHFKALGELKQQFVDAVEILRYEAQPLSDNQHSK